MELIKKLDFCDPEQVPNPGCKSKVPGSGSEFAPPPILEHRHADRGGLLALAPQQPGVHALRAGGGGCPLHRPERQPECSGERGQYAGLEIRSHSKL